MLTEGGEEVGIDLTNTFIDNLVNGGASELMQQRRELIAQGYDEKTAEAMVTRNYAKQLGMSFAGGAVSGGVMGAGASVINGARNIKANLANAQRANTQSDVSTSENSVSNDFVDANKMAEPTSNMESKTATDSRNTEFNPLEPETIFKGQNTAENSADTSNLGEGNAAEYSTNAVDENAYHTEEQIKQIDAYKKAVDENVLSYIENVTNGEYAKPVSVATIDNKAAARIKELTGVETYGNDVLLNESGLQHIFNRHGENGKANSSMENVNDIARIGYILRNYDNIDYEGRTTTMTKTKDGKPAPTVVFSKKIDGTYYVVEAATDAKTHKNYIVSAYIRKADSQVLIHANNDPQVYVRNVLEQSASVKSIDGSDANVNSTVLKTEQQTFTGTKKVNSMPEMSKELSRFVNMFGSDTAQQLYTELYKSRIYFVI